MSRVSVARDTPSSDCSRSKEMTLCGLSSPVSRCRRSVRDIRICSCQRVECVTDSTCGLGGIDRAVLPESAGAMDRRAHPFAQVQDHLKAVVIHAPFQALCSFPGNYSEFPNSSIGERLSALRQHTHMTLCGGHPFDNAPQAVIASPRPNRHSAAVAR